MLEKSNSKKSYKVSILSTILTIVLLTVWKCKDFKTTDTSTKIDYCPKLSKIVPSDDLLDITHFRSDEYKNHSLNVWQNAIRIYTPSFDDLGPVGQDKRWDVFFDFEKYLHKAFPIVHDIAKLDHVNTHGLVYTIKGSDESLKPILLTGHQDVVPVPPETFKRWTYPPFEAHFDGKYVWGRGSSDCKNNVIGIFEALEKLLSQGFITKRTVVIALGFDEESSGEEGAQEISKFLLSKFGNNSFFSIIDEGGLGIQDFYGSRFALPSTGEKGYVDIIIELTTTGGHSSIPPKHTGIGIISHLVTLIENHEYELDITKNNPFFYQLQCEAQYGETIDPKLKSNILDIENPNSKEKVLKVISSDITTKALLSTTRAVDIIYGGLKINALPEKVTLKINHRVGYDSSVKEVKDKISSLTTKIAEIYDLGVISYNNTIKESTNNGQFEISSDSDLDPAPLTSTIGNPSWEILGGTIKNIFEDFAIYDEYDPNVNPEVIVAPSCMTGNTDTKHYWNLSSNIYRFTPIRQKSRENAHAIDEKVELDAHIEGVAFYYQYIRNVN